MLFLLDASAVLNNFGFEFEKKHSFLTTNLVLAEFRDIRTRNLADNALKKGTLKVIDPSPISVQKARSIANSLECKNLSIADVSILALAIELKAERKGFVLITDDHLLQFACKQLGIAFESVIRGKTRKKVQRYKKTPKKQ